MCQSIQVLSADSAFAIKARLGGGTYRLVLTLLPQRVNGMTVTGLNCTYTFQARVVNREVRLAELAQQMAELQATVGAMEDFGRGKEAAATQQQYRAAVQERDGLLREAYEAQTTSHASRKGLVTCPGCPYKRPSVFAVWCQHDLHNFRRKAKVPCRWIDRDWQVGALSLDDGRQEAVLAQRHHEIAYEQRDISQDASLQRQPHVTRIGMDRHSRQRGWCWDSILYCKERASSSTTVNYWRWGGCSLFLLKACHVRQRRYSR